MSAAIGPGDWVECIDASPREVPGYAAPDLLEALEDALRMVKQYGPPGIERSARCKRATAAIAKALGTSETRS